MARVTRRRFLLGTVGSIAAGAVWLEGCAPSSAPSSAPPTVATQPPAAKPVATQPAAQATAAPAQPKGVTIRALVYPYPVTAAIRATLPEYEKQTGVKVEWDEAPFDQLLSKQMAELVAKSDRYDLYVTSNMWLGAEAGTGQLQELDGFISQAGADLDWNDFMPNQRQMYTYKGKVYGIPISCNMVMTAYRADVFEQEGIKVPPLGTSFSMDEWTATVKGLTKNGQFGTVFVTMPMTVCVQRWSNPMMSMGGRFFDEKLNPVFNSKEGVAAAEYMRELMNYAPQDMLRYTNTEASESVMRGDTMTHTQHWASRIPMIEDKEKSKVVGKVRWTTIEYSPSAAGQKVGIAHNDGWGLLIPKGSKNQQATFDFAAWTMTKEKQARYLSDTLTPPSRTSVFEKPELQQRFSWLPVMKLQLQNSFDFPIIPEWAEIMEKVGSELHAGWSGQRSLKEALDRGNSLVAELLKERNYPVGTYSGAKLPWE